MNKRTLVSQAIAHAYLTHCEGATELYLIAPAESDDVDRGLSPLGETQCRLLAERLAGLPATAIYAAEEPGSAATATVLGYEARLPVRLVPELRDIDIQHLELRVAPGESAAIEYAARMFGCLPRWDAFPGAEASRAFRRRVVGAIEALAARHPREAVVVVAEGAAINAYLSMVLDIPRDVFFLAEATSISVVRIGEGRYAVRYLNDCSHLQRR